MSDWTSSELDALERLNEMPISAPRADGSFTRPAPIWVVRIGDQIIVRSWRGTGGGWYRKALESGFARIESPTGWIDVSVELIGASQQQSIDDEYRRKYTPRGDWYVQQMLLQTAVDATLRLTPADR